jgi:prepilin-type N-terminal cleavage/methylation domain-containing protein
MTLEMPVPGHPSQRGFSLIEVLVAITVLLVGVLGVVALVDGANAVTARTKAREGATNVARSIVEVGRAVPYKDLDEESLLAALQTRPGLADALAQEGHQVQARGFTYSVTVEVCSMDDPRDDLGVDDGTIDFCPESTPASAGSVQDRNPDDYRRIAVSLSWVRGSSGNAETAKQTSIVPNPIGGLGPSVIDLDPNLGGTSPYVVTSGTTSSITFDVTTSTSATTVNWLFAGSVQGQAVAQDESGKAWEFTWDLESPTPVYDCTWVIGAEAFDQEGRSGAPKAVTVVLNRSRPAAPASLEGGRNGNASGGVHMVDLEWPESQECDVLGYQVLRREGTGAWTPIQCLDQVQPEYHTGLTCLDDDAPEGVQLSYQVRAVDTLPEGGLGFGEPAEIAIDESPQTRPEPPSNLTACIGGSTGCNEANGNPASDGVTVLTWTAPANPDADGDSIYFYRIYRDGTTYNRRYAAYVHGPGVLAWADPSTPDGAHTYCVTAVDERFAESACSPSIVDFP